MKKIINKILDVIFNLYANFLMVYYRYLNKNTKNKKSDKYRVMALPYYSENYPGGHSRIADWKPYFTNDEIVYDVYWASNSRIFLNNFYSENPLRRYRFLFQVLSRRAKLISKINNYDAVWIQRAFVPFYPFKKASFEKLVCHINPNITIDYYDADYESNYKLTVDSAILANKVSVASHYLANYFKKINQKTFYLPFAINHTEYELKNHKNINKNLIIGWMGSPENFKNIKKIEDALIKVENKQKNIKFVFICREKFELKLNNVEFHKWADEGFDYFKTIASFDIGLAPMMEVNEGNLAKTAFKTLEYMSSGVAFVSSPWGTPEHLEHGENVLLAHNNKEWTEHICSLILSKEKREQIGQNAYKTIVDKFSYSEVYKEIKNILLHE